MVIKVEEIQSDLVIQLDEKSLQTAQRKATDTAKKLDQKRVIELEVDVLRAENRLAELNKELRQFKNRAEAPTELRIEANRARTALTQARKDLRDYTKTGTE